MSLRGSLCLSCSLRGDLGSVYGVCSTINADQAKSVQSGVVLLFICRWTLSEVCVDVRENAHIYILLLSLSLFGVVLEQLQRHMPLDTNYIYYTK